MSHATMRTHLGYLKNTHGEAGGSLFPSLYRREQDSKLKAEWRATENNRRARYYRLTASGRRQREQHRAR
jgi:DNA-binding PadR family transcriptional regulator